MTISKGNVGIVEKPKVEEREDGVEEIFEVIIDEEFPNSMTDNKPQIQEAQSTSNRINTKRNKTYLGISYSTSRKIKDGKILKETTGKNVSYRETGIRIKHSPRFNIL